MDIINDKDKKCGNCGYFSRHYANLHGDFHPINCGHCYSENMSLSQSAKIIKKGGVCGFWIPREEQTEKRIENMEYVIRNMAKTLDEYL